VLKTAGHPTQGNQTMQAILTVQMDNAAFEDNPGELSRILSILALRTEDGVNAGDSFTVSDSNGNNVGKLVVSEN
jgi:hypothetical protein